MRASLLLPAAALLSSLLTIEAFAPQRSTRCTRCVRSSRQRGDRHQHDRLAIQAQDEQDDNDCTNINNIDNIIETFDQPTRRSVLRSTALSFSLLTSSSQSADAIALNPFNPTQQPRPFTPSKRCTAYLVDSTIPPSLIPHRARREASVLKKLGTGYGTSKEPYLRDEVNLNNFMNKAVYGTMDSISSLTGGRNDGRLLPASFVFMGANFDETYTARGDDAADAILAAELMKDICRPEIRRGENTAIAVAFVPASGQGALDSYVYSKTGEEDVLLDALIRELTSVGADETLARKHIPVFRFARANSHPMLALMPDPADMTTLRKGGLQSLDPAKRDMYVIDPRGFVDLTKDPKFRLYTEKSLLKDFRPSEAATASEERYKAEQAAFFAERIFVHEAAATRMAKWAAERPRSLVIDIAGISDVRFMGGMNGRVPRVYNRLLRGGEMIGEDAVTTILLNPSAKETLSQSKWLRLEIGTAPNNWKYQTKIADYFWFSSMPKVNMLPRMMNEI